MAAFKPKSLGEALRARREELSKEQKGFSLRKVAEEVGISPSYLSRLEKGAYTAPSEEILRNLAWYLKMDFSGLSALSDGMPDHLAKMLKDQHTEIEEMLTKIEDIPKKDRKEYRDELHDVALEYSLPKTNLARSSKVASGQALIFPVPQGSSQGAAEIAHGGVKVATTVLEDQGFSVSSHPEFPGNSNALLARKKALVPEKTLTLTVLPKTSGMTRQIRLGSHEFVLQRQESKTEEVYFGFMPKQGSDSVFDGFDLFILPARLAASDGLLAHDLYLSRGKKGIGVVIKDVQREPHKSIMDRWKRCFLYPQAIDWLPV